MEKEIWKDVLEYEGQYQVSNLGRVKSLNYNHTGKEKLLKPGNARYKQVVLCKDGTKSHSSVHRLVYEAFNGPIPEGMQVNHINEDRYDNRLCNLNLLTPSENINWGTCTERISQKQRNCEEKSKKVEQYDLDWNLIRVYESAHEAARQTGYSRGTISNACRGLSNHKLRNNYWKYAA